MSEYSEEDALAVHVDMDEAKRQLAGFWTESGGFMQLITPGPVTPRELDPDEQREAAQKYIEKRYAEVTDPWVSGSIMIDPSDAGATSVYDKMVHRETDGPDPLVPEP